MTSKQITHSIKTGRLHLTGFERLSFYQHVICLALAGTTFGLFGFYLIYLAEEPTRNSLVPIFLFAGTTMLFLIAAAQWLKLYRSLKLTLISTDLPWPESRELLRRLASRQGWIVLNNRKTFVRMRTLPTHWLDLRREQISVFVNRGNIWAVSIRDPDALIAVMDQNRANIQLLLRELSGSRRLSSPE